MKYLIKTPGRTGSHLIADYIRSNEDLEFTIFNEKSDAYGPDKYLAKGIIFDHSLSKPGKTNDSILIISKRKNIVHQLLSGWVGILRAPQDPEKPFEQANHLESLALPIALAELYVFQKNHYEYLKTLPWKEIHEFYMEDFLEDPSVLCSINNGKAPNDWKHAEELGPNNSGLAVNYKDFFTDPDAAYSYVNRLCEEQGIK